MNDFQNGAGGAVEIIDAQVVALDPVRPTRQIALRQEMTPEALKAEIARQTEMRQIMTEYVRNQMVDGHHYYSFNQGDKPALTQDGAFLICGLFKAIPGQVETNIIREDSGHFTVVAKAPLYNADGLQIASGDGSCSTRESKYAYRWAWENEVPDNLDKKSLKTKTITAKNNRQFTKYQVPNQDLADLENTVLKMAIKRATVAAVRKLPLVSELFATDPEDSPRDAKESKPAERKAKPAEQPKDAAIDNAMSEQDLAWRKEIDRLGFMKMREKFDEQPENREAIYIAVLREAVKRVFASEQWALTDDGTAAYLEKFGIIGIDGASRGQLEAAIADLRGLGNL